MRKSRIKFSKLAALIGLLVLISVLCIMAKEPPSGRLPLHQQALFTVISPFQKAAYWIGGGISGAWRHYFYLVGVSKENERLRELAASQNVALAQTRELEVENGRFRALLEFRKLRVKGDAVGASVIANDPRSDFRVVTINRGAADGIAVNSPVVSSNGLVGRVADVGSGTSRVLLVTDPASAVDVVVKRSGARSLLVGERVAMGLVPNYYISRTEYLDRKSDIEKDDLLVTSGLDGVFPAGVPVGTVTELEKNPSGIFRSARVVPLEDLSSLREVLVVR